MTTPEATFEFVVSEEGLVRAVEAVRAAPRVALDTEFMRVDTYYPKLCLVQLAAAGRIFCIDPLAVPDLSPLAGLLGSAAIPKLMHAARQDAEALLVHGKLQLASVHDSQIAAALLGLPEQCGYAWLVEHCCGVVLDKTQTRTDWAQRPLSDAQLHYAAQDVVWLEPVFESLLERLDALGRRGWFLEDCAQASQVETVVPWQRVKGAQQLDDEEFAIVRIVADWREAQAIALDRPRGWLLRDETVLGLARHPPTNLQGVARLPGIAPGTVRRYGATLLELLETARKAPPIERDARGKPGSEVLARISRWSDHVRARAAELQLAPATLAGRKELERLAAGLPVPRLQSGWRREVLGDLAP